MEGEMINRGDVWFVQYEDYGGWGLTEIVNREIPLHPDNLEQLKIYDRVFDHIESRIMSNPKVKFDLVEISDENNDKSETTKTLCAKVHNF